MAARAIYWHPLVFDAIFDEQYIITSKNILRPHILACKICLPEIKIQLLTAPGANLTPSFLVQYTVYDGEDQICCLCQSTIYMTRRIQLFKCRCLQKLIDAEKSRYEEIKS